MRSPNFGKGGWEKLKHVCVRVGKEMGSDKDKKYIKYYFVFCTYHSVQLSRALVRKKEERTQFRTRKRRGWEVEKLRTCACTCDWAKVSLAMAKIFKYILPLPLKDFA